MVAKAATGGVAVVLGFFALKVVMGLVGVAIGFTLFLLFKVLPIVLIAAVVFWLIKKATRSSSSTA
jgi:uncharacterized membrane protein